MTVIVRGDGSEGFTRPVMPADSTRQRIITTVAILIALLDSGCCRNPDLSFEARHAVRALCRWFASRLYEIPLAAVPQPAERRPPSWWLLERQRSAEHAANSSFCDRERGTCIRRSVRETRTMRGDQRMPMKETREGVWPPCSHRPHSHVTADGTYLCLNRTFQCDRRSGFSSRGSRASITRRRGQAISHHDDCAINHTNTPTRVPQEPVFDQRSRARISRKRGRHMEHRSSPNEEEIPPFGSRLSSAPSRIVVAWDASFREDCMIADRVCARSPITDLRSIGTTPAAAARPWLWLWPYPTRRKRRCNQL